MQRVTGIGGIFFKADDPAKLGAWYREHLGLDVQSWGGAVFEGTDPQQAGQTVWATFPRSSSHFAPSGASFMLNYRVANLDAMLDQLRGAGVKVDGRTESGEMGRFGWAMDPEGNRIELWEPPK